MSGFNHLSVPKVVAVKEILSDHNPFIRISDFRDNLYSTIRGIYQMKPDSITVSSVADDNLEGFINEHMVIAGRTMFYVRALRGGKVGRIFRVIPGKDACFQCLSLYRDEKKQLILIEDDLLFPTIRNECNNPVRPASAADLKLISSIASRIIIDYLQTGSTEYNHWIWSTEVLESVQIKTPFSLVSHSLPPHPQCFYCSHDKKFEVTIDATALQNMKYLVAEKSGIETGGVLAGKVGKDGKIRITNSSGPGPLAKHTRTSFEKDVTYCQAFLDDLYKNSGQDIVYLGEWHSHPGTDTTPSGQDIQSLSEIALQQEYLTTNPVMIIFSNQGAPSCSIHPAGKLHYFVELAEIKQEIYEL